MTGINAADLQATLHQPPATAPEPEEEVVEDEPAVVAVRSHPGGWERLLVNLTEAAQRGAIMDAWGASRNEIARECGVAVTTVSWWRKSPVSVAARKAETMNVMADARDRLVRDREGAFEAREKAREKLMELLDATDENGNPQMGVIAAAAKILMEDKAATTGFGDGKSVTNVQVAVGATFHVMPDGEIVEGDVEDGEFSEIPETGKEETDEELGLD